MNLGLISEMFDASVRAEEIIHLPTMAWDEEALADCFKDAIDDDPGQILKVVGLDHIDEDEELYEICEALRDERKAGWLVKFATPVPTAFHESGGYSFSWGYYTSKWMYGDDYEALCREALQWQADFVERRRQKEQTS